MGDEEGSTGDPGPAQLGQTRAGQAQTPSAESGANAAGEPTSPGATGSGPAGGTADTPRAAHLEAAAGERDGTGASVPAAEPGPVGGIPRRSVCASCGRGGEGNPSSGSGSGCGSGCGCGCGCGQNGAEPLVYAIGTIGFDFQTEARRDSFRHQMDPVPGTKTEDGRETEWQPNPYDPNQLRDYLTKNPWAADKLTWTLNVDGTPVYALESEAPVGPDWNEPAFEPTAAREEIRRAAESAAQDRHKLARLLETVMCPPVPTVHRIFRDAIAGQALGGNDPEFVSRVSVPGVLTDRTTRLFSGQVIPVVEVKGHGIHAWHEAKLITSVRQAVDQDVTQRKTEMPGYLEKAIRAFLDKIYYQFRNLGQSSADRALNYVGTNAFLLGSQITEGLLSAKHVPGAEDHFYALDTISVSKSPHCRIGSDCQDVVVTFFDPVDARRSKVSYLFTVDVSDEHPVSLAPVHTFLGGW
ncbi:hypothetical protein [Streptomyces chattanoogensis]|uniref:cyanobactin maturation protease PatG family protein n=1 Tax=Streptomyces chattanoogensis TaxID=66876 RepID=UPI0036B70971